MSNRALILGVNGQDGSYLTEYLLGKGYEVYGAYRHSSVNNLWRIQEAIDTDDQKMFHLCRCDVTDTPSIAKVIKQAQPHEIYHFADQDDVSWSYDLPVQSIDITAGVVARLLELVRLSCTSAKVFLPISATIFGDAPPPQDEESRLNPLSPYACAKVAAYYLARYYRQCYGLFIATCIYYNHDSPRRCGENYLLQKICRGAVRIARGDQREIRLGNLDTKVDIGFAGDYVKAAYKALQRLKPDDYVIGTGQAYSIRELAMQALVTAGATGDHHLAKDPSYYRPEPSPTLCADPTKAANKLCWNASTSVNKLISYIVRAAEKGELR